MDGPDKNLVFLRQGRTTLKFDLPLQPAAVADSFGLEQNQELHLTQNGRTVPFTQVSTGLCYDVNGFPKDVKGLEEEYQKVVKTHLLMKRKYQQLEEGFHKRRKICADLSVSIQLVLASLGMSFVKWLHFSMHTQVALVELRNISGESSPLPAALETPSHSPSKSTDSSPTPTSTSLSIQPNQHLNQSPIRRVIKCSTLPRYTREKQFLEILQDHPQILAVRDVIEIPQKLYALVFDQYSLEPFVPRNDTERKSYMYQVLKGLADCHRHHIIHRDVKPSNIFHRRGDLELKASGELEVVLGDSIWLSWKVLILQENSNMQELFLIWLRRCYLLALLLLLSRMCGVLLFSFVKWYSEFKCSLMWTTEKIFLEK